MSSALAAYNTATGSYALKWSRFPTHARVSRNKTKVDRFVKVNGQRIYDGSLTRFSRAYVIDDLHSLLEEPLLVLLARMDATAGRITAGAWHSELILGLPRGYGEVKRRTTKKRGVVIEGGEKATRATFDVDNQWIWRKVFQDACVKLGLLDTDTVERIQRTSNDVRFVPTLADRYLLFRFHPLA